MNHTQLIMEHGEKIISNTEMADKSSFWMALQFWRMINMLSPVTPLQPVKLIDLRSLQVLEIPSIALRVNAEFHPPEFNIL